MYRGRSGQLRGSMVQISSGPNFDHNDANDKLDGGKHGASYDHGNNGHDKHHQPAASRSCVRQSTRQRAL